MNAQVFQFGKPLKNLQFVREEDGGEEWWVAQTPFGYYTIQQEHAGVGLFEALAPELAFEGARILCDDAETFEHARRVCQQHFHKTVLECFGP